MQCNCLKPVWMHQCKHFKSICPVVGCSSVVGYSPSEIEQASVFFRDSSIDNFIEYDEFTLMQRDLIWCRLGRGNHIFFEKFKNNKIISVKLNSEIFQAPLLLNAALFDLF